MKKTETIALYRDTFLEGRDEIDRRKFDEKNVDKQYASIMAWKRRKELANTTNKISVSSISGILKNVKKTIVELPELQTKDAEKLVALVDAIKSEIADFEIIKKGQLLRKLRSQRNSLDKEIEQLENAGVKEC